MTVPARRNSASPSILVSTSGRPVILLPNTNVAGFFSTSSGIASCKLLEGFNICALTNPLKVSVVDSAMNERSLKGR